MNVTLPNGKVIEGVPEGASKDEIAMKAIGAGLATREDFGMQAPVDASSMSEIGNAPELNEFSMPAFRASLGLMLTGDDESLKGLFTKQFGDKVTFSQGEEGETVANLPSGSYVLNKPGLSGQDVVRFLGQAAMFTPAGRAGSVGGAALGSAATQTGVDIAEQSLGGRDIEAGDVVEAGLLGGAFKGLENLVGGAYRYLRGTPQSEVVKEGLEQGVPVMTSDVLPPSTFAGKMAQQTAEKIPVAGTGAAREIQQDFRTQAVQEVADKYSTFSYDAIIDSMKKQKDRLKFAAGNTLQSTGEKLDSVGDIGMDNTSQVIERVKTELSKPGVIKSEGAIADLSKLIDALGESKQTFTSLKENRTAFRDIIEGADNAARSQLPSRAKALLTSIQSAMTKDMDEFAKANLSPKEYASWKNANAIYAEQANLLKNSKLKNVLDKGDVTPESVRGLLFSRNQSELKLAYNSMTQTGRENARAAIISNIVDNVSRRAGGMTPNAFATEMKKFAPQIETFFKGQEKKQLQGLQLLLDATRRAQDAAVTTPTGQQVLGAGTLAAAATDLGATVLTGGTVGGIARLYESAPVRDSLLRLASVPKGSTQFEKALLDAQTALNAIAQSERSRQAEQE